MNHLMIDIETLGTETSSVVLSVGYAVFNEDKVLNSWHMSLEFPEQMSAGRTVNPDTIGWWLQRSPEIVKRAFSQEHGVDELYHSLADTILNCEIGHFWANSPSFDLIILESLFKGVLGLPSPMGFRKWLDCRTLGFVTGSKIPRSENQHDAEADAVDQAQWVIDQMQLLELHGVSR